LAKIDTLVSQIRDVNTDADIARVTPPIGNVAEFYPAVDNILVDATVSTDWNIIR